MQDNVFTYGLYINPPKAGKLARKAGLRLGKDGLDKLNWDYGFNQASNMGSV